MSRILKKKKKANKEKYDNKELFSWSTADNKILDYNTISTLESMKEDLVNAAAEVTDTVVTEKLQEALQPINNNITNINKK